MAGPEEGLKGQKGIRFKVQEKTVQPTGHQRNMKMDFSKLRTINSELYLRAKILLILLFLLPGIFLAPATARADTAPPPPSSWFIDTSRFALSAHGSLTCATCHGTMNEDQKKHPEPNEKGFLKQEAGLKYDYKRCQTCHTLAYNRTLKGAHAQAREKEQENRALGKPLQARKFKAPACGDCHSSHYEPALRSRLEIGRASTEVCGACHPAQRQTYLDNYHGKAAVGLGKTKAAFCTDCHGAHDCRSLKDRTQALEACRRCHPQASLSFAGLIIHPTLKNGTPVDPEKKAKVAVIQILSLIMGALVLVVVVFFYGHTLLWFLREIHEKLRKHP
jgi:ribosomal protein L31